MTIKKRTIIEKLFGKGKKQKDLTKEQLTILRRYHRENESEEAKQRRKEYQREYQLKYYHDHKDDPEYRERLKATHAKHLAKHGKKYKKKREQTFIEEMFGEGLTQKDLTPEQLKLLRNRYNDNFLEGLTEEEKLEMYKRRMKNYRDNHTEDYREYQREYRRKRRLEDPEFAERCKKHARNYERRKKNEDEIS